MPVADPDALPLSMEEHSAATQLRELAPLLAEGVTCALRDQPADPAGFMAEFIASRDPDSRQVVEQRKIALECAHLDAEAAKLKQQLDAARKHRAARMPSEQETEEEHNALRAAAAWRETCRLKRLIRSIKVKVSEPLSVSDWPIPEGLVLIQGARGTGVGSLCRQLAADFPVSLVQAGNVLHDARADPLGAVADTLRRQPQQLALLEGYLDPQLGAREQLYECVRRVGRPTALLLLGYEQRATHVRRLQEEAAVSGRALGSDAAKAIVDEWAEGEAVALGELAAQACIPVVRATADGDFNARMISVLLALSKI